MAGRYDRDPKYIKEDSGDVSVKCLKFKDCFTTGVNIDSCPVTNTRLSCFRGSILLTWTEYLKLNNECFIEV